MMGGLWRDSGWQPPDMESGSSAVGLGHNIHPCPQPLPHSAQIAQGK